MRKALVLGILGTLLGVGISGAKVQPPEILVGGEKISPVLLKVEPLSPEEREELLKGIRELRKDGIKVGVGEPEIVVFFDPLCPYCREAVKSGELEKLKNKSVFIPVSVHGKQGTVLAAYLLKKAKREPLPLVVKGWFNEEVEVCEKDLEKCIKEKEKSLTRGDLYELEKVEGLFRKLRLTAVPCFINLKTGTVQYGFKSH